VSVGEQRLRKWHARLAPQPEPCGENASLDELRVENQRLRRELRRAETLDYLSPINSKPNTPREQWRKLPPPVSENPGSSHATIWEVIV
jgi:hypothetical protein